MTHQLLANANAKANLSALHAILDERGAARVVNAHANDGWSGSRTAEQGASPYDLMTCTYTCWGRPKLVHGVAM